MVCVLPICGYLYWEVYEYNEDFKILQEKLSLLDVTREDVKRIQKESSLDTLEIKSKLSAIGGIANDGMQSARRLLHRDFAGRFYYIFAYEYVHWKKELKDTTYKAETEAVLMQKNIFGTPDSYADMLVFSGQRWDDEGHLDSAFMRYRYAETILRNTHPPDGLEGVLNDMALLWMDVQNLNDANRVLTQVAREAENKGNLEPDNEQYFIELAAGANANLALAHMEKGNVNDVEIAMTKAKEKFESLSNYAQQKLILDELYIGYLQGDSVKMSSLRDRFRSNVLDDLVKSDRLIDGLKEKPSLLKITLTAENRFPLAHDVYIYYSFLNGCYFKSFDKDTMAFENLERAFVMSSAVKNFRLMYLSCQEMIDLPQCPESYRKKFQQLLAKKNSFVSSFYNVQKKQFITEPRPWLGFIQKRSLLGAALVLVSTLVITGLNRKRSAAKFPAIPGTSDQLVLFIHGLGGNISTWKHFYRLIENDSQLKGIYTIGFYNFPTSLTTWTFRFWKRRPGIQMLSDGLRSELNVRYGSYKKVMLVCHSLGGLVARQFLMEEVKNGRPLRVNKLLLYATPNTGSLLANIGFRLTFRHRQIEQLRPNSDFLKTLNEDWTRQKVTDKVQCVYMIAGQDVVVNEMSARGTFGNDNVFVDNFKDHFTVIKPDNDQELSYLVFKKLLFSGSTGRTPFTDAGMPKKVLTDRQLEHLIESLIRLSQDEKLAAPVTDTLAKLKDVTFPQLLYHEADHAQKIKIVFTRIKHELENSADSDPDTLVRKSLEIIRASFS